jgi:hypothetical protein
MGETFISEAITPAEGTLGLKMAARGEPALPRAFDWRKQRHRIVEVEATWKTSSREGGRRSGELYLRRHWYRVVTDTGWTATIYCQRQARSAKRPKARWYVFSAEHCPGDGRQGGATQEPR